MKKQMRKWKKLHGRQKGFTLIELMIVVAIIAILAAVAIPNFLRARDRSRISACISQMVTLSSAAQDYIVERGNLADLGGDYHELCIHVYAGADAVGDCDQALEDKIDAVCLENSFNYVQNDDFSYDMQAEARNKNHCFVCVTENMVVPPDDNIPACYRFTTCQR